MITEKEFLEAVKIVKQYQKQISKVVSEVKNISETIIASKFPDISKMLISDWVKWLSVNTPDHPRTPCYARLLITLKLYAYNKDKCVADLRKDDIFCYRNFGKGSWELFLKLTGRTE
jgi:hypothetical protein